MAAVNVRRLTALAYFMLLTIGVIRSLAGVVTPDIAQTFAVDTYVIGYCFTLFTAGYSLALIINGFVIDKADIKKETLLAIHVTILGIIGATYSQSPAVFALFSFAYGFGLGIILSVAYYLIVQNHDEAGRAGKVNMLNFFFGVGAIAAPLIAGIALQQGASWQWIYRGTLLLLIVACYAVWVLPVGTKRFGRAAAQDGENWGAAVYIIGVALFCYLLSEMIVGFWLVIYLLDALAIDVAIAGSALSVFWIFMAAGRLLAGTIIAKVSLRRYILIFSALAAAAVLALLKVSNPWLAIAVVACIGFGYSGLYGSIISFGTLQVSAPSAKLTTFFLAIGSTGAIISFLLSSYLKQMFNLTSVLVGAAGLMGAVALLIAAAGVIQDARSHAAKP